MKHIKERNPSLDMTSMSVELMEDQERASITGGYKFGESFTEDALIALSVLFCCGKFILRTASAAGKWDKYSKAMEDLDKIHTDLSTAVNLNPSLATYIASNGLQFPTKDLMEKSSLKAYIEKQTTSSAVGVLLNMTAAGVFGYVSADVGKSMVDQYKHEIMQGNQLSDQLGKG